MINWGEKRLELVDIGCGDKALILSSKGRFIRFEYVQPLIAQLEVAREALRKAEKDMSRMWEILTDFPEYPHPDIVSIREALAKMKEMEG